MKDPGAPSSWMLLGGAAGINLTQRLWGLLGFGVGEVSIAVPVGGWPAHWAGRSWA